MYTNKYHKNRPQHMTIEKVLVDEGKKMWRDKTGEWDSNHELFGNLISNSNTDINKQ